MKKTTAASKKQQQEIPAGNEFISVSGARVHNLKNVEISIPKNELVVITGISGSGKSSLAFDMSMTAKVSRAQTKKVKANFRLKLNWLTKLEIRCMPLRVIILLCIY